MQSTTGKKLIYFILAVIFAVTAAGSLSACKSGKSGKTSSSAGTSVSPSPGPKRYTPDEDKIAVFAYGGADNFRASKNYSNGAPFNCVWRSANVTFGGGVMSLTLSSNGRYYESGEYRSNDYYHYGYYSVSMKAANCSGVISSFFTYTGRPWDEIDIEFLGNDTTKIQFNYYTNGVGGHEYVYYLGFDGAEDFHEYGFDWKEDAIVWYVDGRAVWKSTADIPSAAGQIMANVWTGTGDTFVNWCGEFDDSKLPVSAEYQWFGYKAA